MILKSLLRKKLLYFCLFLFNIKYFSMKNTSLLSLLLIVFFAQAQQPKNYDLLDLKAHISINPYQKTVKVKLIYRLKILKNTSKIIFDAPDINTQQVKIGCFSTDFIQNKKELIIHKKFKKNKVYKVQIHYTARPQKAMYFTGWKNGNKKQVWTQGQGKNNSHWLPTNDNQNDKFTWTFHIYFPKPYRVISNGVLKKVYKKNDSIRKFIYHQSKPAPAYLIFIGIGKFIETKFLSSNGIPVFNYQYENIENDKTYYQSKTIFDFIEKQIGVPYPWDNYKQIPCRDFLYGGMENVSATSFNGDRYVIDHIEFNDINFVNISAHELVHQWFGDLVTGKSSYDHWLHEGFATYYARLVDAQIFGKNYNDYNVYLYDRKIIHKQNTDTIPIHRPNASSLTYYQKGARVVEMLREKVGKENFEIIIKKFLTRYAYKNATISDFKKIVYEVTNDNLTNFFNLWLESHHIPKIVLKQKNDSIIFLKNDYKLTVDFQIITNDSVYYHSHNKSFKINNIQHIQTIIANYGNKKLYDIKFERNRKWIVYQILKAPEFIDRYVAMEHLNTFNKNQKDSIFNILIQQDNYYPVYGKIIENIRKDLSPKRINFLKELFKKDLKTRQQIAILLTNVPKDIKEEYKKLLYDSSYVSKRNALWNYWKSFKDEQKNILDETQNFKTDRNKYFRLYWLSLALITHEYQSQNKQKFIREIISYASPRYNLSVRTNAMELIDALQIINEESISYIIDAAFHFNRHLHLPARQILKNWSKNSYYKNLIIYQTEKLDSKKRTSLLNWIN